MNEAFSSNFRLAELNKIKDFGDKIHYCVKNLGPCMGKGSSRAIFDFTDDVVFKIAFNEKGVSQNKAESELSKRNESVVVKCFDVAPDYSWILEENALPAEEGDFNLCLGLDFVEVQEFIIACYKMYGSEKCPYHEMDYDDVDFYLNHDKNSWWFQGMLNYMRNSNLPYGDLIHLTSYGMVKRGNDPQIVVLDSGLTQDILNKHYRGTINEKLKRQKYFMNYWNEKTNSAYSLEEEVSVKPFEPKDELNPKFWVNNKLNSKVRMRLLDIADDFVKTLNIRWVKPYDIVLTGSIANYNWTKFSDVDVHIIMDFSKVYKKTDFVKSYFDAKKEEWNGSHEGLKIYGFNVELSVEDKNAPAVASGVYSLEKNDWISEPKDLSDAKLNKEYVETTAESYINKIDDIDRRIRKEKDAKKVEILSNKMVSIFNKLKGMRKEGLKSKSKEMSSGNIVWKILRAEGYIKKIWDIVNYNYDRSMSLNEGYWGHLPLQNDYILDDLHELADENITPLVKELEKVYKNAVNKDATPKEETHIIVSTDNDDKEEREERKSVTSERYESLQDIFHLTNKIIYLIWSAAEWGPSKLEKEGIDIKKLLNDSIDLLDDDVWLDGWEDGKKKEKEYLKRLKHWVDLLVDKPYDKSKERYDKIKIGKDLGFLRELDEAVTGTDNKKASALYVYALDKKNGTYHLLCARRKKLKDDKEGGKWNPPMGHVHRGEDMLDGAIRECMEESGVDFSKQKSSVKLMDSHRWGNNYRLILKNKYITDFKPGEGDEENDKFIWLPLGEIKEKKWAYSCGENAEKYAPKTVTLNEGQMRMVEDMIKGDTIKLYHGANVNKMEFNLEAGGFTPRVCAEGGPEAVYLSSEPHEYNFVFSFEMPKSLIGKKLFQQTNIDYIFTDFISFDDFNCKLEYSEIIAMDNGIAAYINVNDIDMCKKQFNLRPGIFKNLVDRTMDYPFVFDTYIEPLLDKIGYFDKLNENKRNVIIREEQMEGANPMFQNRYLKSYLPKFKKKLKDNTINMPQLHFVMKYLGFKQVIPGVYTKNDIEFLLSRPDLIRKVLGMNEPSVDNIISFKDEPPLQTQNTKNEPYTFDNVPPLSNMENASNELLRNDDVYYG